MTCFNSIKTGSYRRLLVEKILNHLMNEMTKREIAYLMIGILIDMLIQEIFKG